MKQLVSIQHASHVNQSHDNLACVLFSQRQHQGKQDIEDESEQELVKALKDKYDAVKEKIYEEALKA